MVLQVAGRAITATGKESFPPLPSFLHDTDLEIQFVVHGPIGHFFWSTWSSLGSLFVFLLLPPPACSSEGGICSVFHFCKQPCLRLVALSKVPICRVALCVHPAGLNEGTKASWLINTYVFLDKYMLDINVCIFYLNSLWPKGQRQAITGLPENMWV